MRLSLKRSANSRNSSKIVRSPEHVRASLFTPFRDPVPTLAEMERMLELRRAGRNRQVPSLAWRMQAAVSKTPAHNRLFEMVLEPLTEVLVQQIKITDDLGVELHRNFLGNIAPSRCSPPTGRFTYDVKI